MAETTFERAQVGDRVWNATYGWGEIKDINCCRQTLLVSFSPLWHARPGGLFEFNFRGEIVEPGVGINLQSLFWSEVNITAPERPKRKVKKTVERWAAVNPIGDVELGQAHRDIRGGRMSERGTVLDEAKATINGERQDQYGSPEDSFALIAEYWSTYLTSLAPELDPVTVRPVDVAHMMGLMKIARMSGQCYQRDNYRDLAGYCGIACDMREKEAGQ